MALGLSPEYTHTLGFGGLSNQQFLPLAVGTAKQLGWTVGGISETGFFARIPASTKSPGEEFRVMIWDGLATIKSESPGSQLVDWGKNKKNVQAFIDQFEIAKSAADPGLLQQQYLELVLGDDGADLARPVEGSFFDVFAIFRPVNGYFITPIIVDLNILVFMLMVISGAGFWSADIQTLVAWGADYRPLTINGESWRLITSIFLHNGITHLFLNMATLIYIGVLLEPHLGKLRFFAAYFLTGIAASIASTCWNDRIVSAGASGAIFGLCGVFLAMLTTNFLERSTRNRMLMGLSIFVAYSLVGGREKDVDNAAHIGGLVCGLFIGYAYYPSLKKPASAALETQTVAAASIVILGICLLVYQNIPNDFGKYKEKMKTFAVMENRALKACDLPKNMSKDSLLARLKNPGIYYWNECIKLLDSLDQLKLPGNIQERNQMLKRYCTLCISSYKLTYKAVYDNTNMFKDSEAYYRKNIKAIVDSLDKK